MSCKKLYLFARCFKIFIFLPFLFFACLDQEGALSIESEDPQLVVDGVLINGQRPSVFVGTTAPTLTRNLTFRIPDSLISVTILENGLPFLELEVAERELFGNEGAIPRSNSRYTLDSVISLRQNASYQLVVIAENLPTLISPELVYQESLALNQFTINKDTISFGNNACLIGKLSVLSNANRNGENTLWVDTYLEGDPFESREVFGNSLFGKFERTAEGEKLDLSWPSEGVSCNFIENRLNILVIAAPSEYTDFMRLRDNSLLDLGGVFSVPEELPHNVEGGYGFFGLGSSIELTEL